jgi:hypothetical protein
MSGCLAVGGGRENNAVVVGVEFDGQKLWLLLIQMAGGVKSSMS